MHSEAVQDPDPARNGVGGACAGDTQAILAALTQINRALHVLASRSRGVEAMTMLMQMLSSRAGGSTGFAPAPLPAALAPAHGFIESASVSRPLPAPSDAELTRWCHDLIDALDRGDVAAVAAVLAPGFVAFRGGPAKDRDAVLATASQRTSKMPYIAKRTWHHESVVRKDDALVFTGKAHEVQGGNDTHGGYTYDGWYLLQWVRSGDAWQLQLLTWQKESTDREWWNETFARGRGFSREPNGLLVEVTKDATPGTALDLATGQGRNALYLVSQGWKVTGIDLSDEGLRIAREQAARHGLAIETVIADIDEWDFGEDRFDLVTLIYAGDDAKWIHKIKASLRKGGLLVVEGWAKVSPDSPRGFEQGQLARLFDGFEILRDEIVEDAPDWAWDTGKLARFVARKK